MGEGESAMNGDCELRRIRLGEWKTQQNMGELGRTIWVLFIFPYSQIPNSRYFFLLFLQFFFSSVFAIQSRGMKEPNTKLVITTFVNLADVLTKQNKKSN